MFSEASVSHSVHNRPHGYSVTAHPCYSAFGMHPTGMLSCYYLQTKFAKVILSKAAVSHSVGGGVRAGETATEAGGTHPTGMHSC